MHEKIIAQARPFIEQQARPLERALFHHYIDQTPVETVLDALAPYQHENGGFGHALEPDFRLPAPSVMATSYALQILTELKTDPQHVMILKAITFLLEQFDETKETWNNLPPSASDHPHAPWWSYGMGNRLTCSQSFQANCGIELAGYFWYCKAVFNDAFLQRMSRKVASLMEHLPATLDMHEMLCMIRFVDTDSAPAHDRAIVKERLHEYLDDVVERNPAQWPEYCATPMMLAPHPRSCLAQTLYPDIERNVLYLKKTQGEDGTWAPTWTWNTDSAATEWPAQWEQAKTEWKGILTVKNIQALRAYGIA